MAGTVVTAAVNNINIVNGTASLDVAAASAVDVNANLTVNNATTLTGSPYTPGGTDVVVADGGTGASTLTDHGVLVGSGTDPVTALAVGTNGQVLVGSTGADPVFATITDGEGIDTTLGAGTLTIAAETASETNPGVIEIATDAETIAGSDTARGITASNLKAKLGTQTDGGLLVGGGQTAAVEALPVGLTTQVLVGGGAGTNPAWGTDIPTGVTIGAAYIYRAAGTDIPVTDGGTGVSTLTTAYGLLAAGTTATGTVQTLAAGTSGYLLQSGGASALPSWTNTPALGTPASGDATNMTTDTPTDNDSSTQIASTAFAKSQDAVLHREPDQGVAMTAAASGSSGITVTDDDDIDFGTDNFTMVWKGSLPDWSPGTTQTLQLKFQDSDNYTQLYVETTGVIKLFVVVGGLTKVSDVAVTGVVTNVGGSSHEIVLVVTRETASVAGSFAGYIDGILSLTTAITAGAPVSFSNTGTFYIFGTSSVRNAGTTYHTYLLNFAPTAAEVLDMYRNGIPESWKWGSQTELMPNQVDRDFSGASAWANVDLNAYDETGDLTITATAANQYCTCPVASAPTTIGKKYRMEFDIANIVSTWTIKSFDGTQTIGTVTANGTDTRIEWTATTTGGYRIVSDSTTSSGDFDNFSLVQIGATLALLPENIQQDKWYDASSNGLNATYPTTGWSLTRPPAARHIWPAVTAKTTAVTLTIAELLTLYITGTHAVGATQAYTLPTGALCDDWPAFETVKGFEWTLTNLSAAAVDTITLTADTGHTIVGNPIVQSAHSSTGGIYGNSARWLTVKTAADTFETRRLA